MLTALGVFQGMRAAAAHRWGSDSLAGRRVGIAGVGKVGHLLVGLLAEDGAEAVVTDVSEQALARVRDEHPGVSGGRLDRRARRAATSTSTRRARSAAR